MALANAANCKSCRFAAKEDGGDGRCPRTTAYESLRLMPLHDCPLFKRRPRPRAQEAPKPEALF